MMWRVRQRDIHWCLSLSSALFLAFIAPVFSSVAGKAQEIEKKPPEEYVRLEQALDAMWEKQPLTIRRALYVAAPPGGYGVFNPRGSAEFSKKAHKEAIIYIEPMFYGFGREGELHTIDIRIGLALQDAKGERTLVQVKDFGRTHLRSRHRNKEFFIDVTLGIGSLPEGRYRLLLTLTDGNGKANAKVALPLVITP